MAKKKKNLGGRPAAADDERKRLRTYRCGDKDYATIEQAGQPNVSEWTRKTLLRAARRRGK
jgi:hypothetical protein